VIVAVLPGFITAVFKHPAPFNWAAVQVANAPVPVTLTGVVLAGTASVTRTSPMADWLGPLFLTRIVYVI